MKRNISNYPQNFPSTIRGGIFPLFGAFSRVDLTQMPTVYPSPPHDYMTPQCALGSGAAGQYSIYVGTTSSTLAVRTTQWPTQIVLGLGDLVLKGRTSDLGTWVKGRGMGSKGSAFSANDKNKISLGSPGCQGC